MRSTAELIDKMLGDAYKVVKHVYDHMADVLAVGGAIRASAIGAPLLLQRSVKEQGSTGDPGEEIRIPFTDLDTDHEKIIASCAYVIGKDSGDRYFAESGVFTAIVRSDGLWIKLANDAPADVQFAVVEWVFLYEG